jgi:hypothetical protein
MNRSPLLRACAVSLTLGAAPAHADGPDPAGDAARVARGFRIAPVPLRLAGLDRDLVGLGSYLVNGVGACSECHTHPAFAEGGDPFLGQEKQVNADGYLMGGTVFRPGVVSVDLTPDANGRPAGLTLAEFVQAMRTGRDPDDPQRQLQIMPWPVYQEMEFTDLKAIYTYLRAIPSGAAPRS